ncbi:PAS-domain containing protein [Limibaculum sp. M0105]|uniref:histidine kinase n=2 Tax=Thermohalobaculum xanthum TaxID=2753746 RepID=A0A8J7M7R2_9RHOB|nr:PAS-domain containing protein [Thermohalobaculum xanthum]
MTEMGADLLSATIALLSLSVCVLATLFVRERRGRAREVRRREDLSDGMVLRARNGRITDLSDAAAELPGAAPGAMLTDVIASAIGQRRDEVQTALARLIETGEPMHLLARRTAGGQCEVIGFPSGGESVLVLRDARLIAAELERAETALARRERSLSAGWYERETIATLLEIGATIAWHRTADGAVSWCAGQVRTEMGAVAAEQVVTFLGVRPPQREAADGIDRTRIEILPPGGIEPVSLSVVEVLKPDGRRFGFATDASNAVTAERTLSRFVQTMTETFAHLTVGLAIFDRNQKLALFNPALAQMLQLDPATLAARPTLSDLVDAMRRTRRIPETGDYHLWRRQLLGLFDDTEVVDYEDTWHLADGSSINVLARPHPHGSLAFVFDDVSERMRLEQNYRRSVDLRHATLNRLEEGLAVFGADGLLQFVNDAFHDIWGTDADSICAGMHAREVMRLCQGLTIETEVWRRVTGFITSDETRRALSARVTLGSSRILSARLAPLPGGASMVVFADITDSERIALALRERNEALEAVEEMRTAVLDQISHRLRTPLNTIFGFGQLLGDPRFGTLTPDQRDYADGILEASGQLLDTIDDVTELASLQLDPLHDEGADPPLAETLELTRQLLDKRAVEAGVVLATELPDAAIKLRCDAVRLRQIVFNMVAGAIQRSPSGTRILLSATEPQPGRVEIVVTERREAEIPLADFAEDGESLAFSVIRRMVVNEGGRFERRRGTRPSDAVSVCSFDRGAAEESPSRASHEARPQPLPLTR